MGCIIFGLYSLFLNFQNDSKLNIQNSFSATETNSSQNNQESVKQGDLLQEPAKGQSESVTEDLTEKDETVIEVIEYVNQKYGYAVYFPRKWHINTDSSENPFREIDLNEKEKFMVSGQTFWSNYQDINKFTPSDKPDDFRLLSLAVYKKDSLKAIEEFASAAGFYIEGDTQKIPFSAKDASGIEFLTPGMSKENPKIHIIFQREDIFYVFTLAFTNSDPEVISDMERIAKGLKLM